MRATRRALLTCAGLGLALAPVYGQAKAKTDPPGGDKSLGLQVLLGGTFQASGDRKSDSFHRLIYKGSMLSQKGEKAKNTDPSHQFFNTGEAEGAGSNDLSFDLVQGAGKVKNDILNGYGIDKLPVPKLFGSNFRSILRGGANLDGSQANMALGYEMHSLPVPVRFVNASWFIPGINAEQRMTKGSKAETVGTLTYRMFLGNSTWKKGVKPAPFSLQDVLKIAPTVEDLRKYVAAGPKSGNRDLDNFIMDQAGSEAYSVPNVKYAAVIGRAYDKETLAFQLGLADALWVEGDGWWDFVGREHPRAKSFFAVVWSIYRNSETSANTQFQVRYETGFDRNQPDRINRVMGTVGFVF